MSDISFDIEKKLFNEGYKTIAGIDEAGRGALAGPLVLGLVIFSEQFIINTPAEILQEVRDSKVLTASKRVNALNIIKNYSEYTDEEIVSHTIVDRLNINAATEYAVKRLIEKATPAPDAVIMDGNFRFNITIPFFSIIKGDMKSISIASASIAAKVYRDDLMRKYEDQYPGYLFYKNKGYGTREHKEAIFRLGPCAIHRKSYEPVKSIVSKNN